MTKTTIVREIVVVSGTNFPEYKPTTQKTRWALHTEPNLAYDWQQRARRLMQWRLSEYDYVVTWFDLAEGSRQTVTLDKKKTLTFRREGAASPLRWDNYRILAEEGGESVYKPLTKTYQSEKEPDVRYVTGAHEFGNKPFKLTSYLEALGRLGFNSVDSASIADVYRYLEAQGEDETTAGTVAELHILSHSFIEGPVIANTDDLSAKTEKKRHPLDKDGRARKDFAEDNVDRRKLAAAFTMDASGFVWGCTQHKFPLNVAKTAMGQLAKAKNDSDKVFEFEWNPELRISLVEFHRLFGNKEESLQQKPSQKSGKKSLIDVTSVLRKVMDSTYMQHLANAAQISVMGALPGTYADFEDKWPRRTPDDRLLHIPENLVSILRFYERIGATFDRTAFLSPAFKGKYGRGYGLYLPR